MNLREMFTDAVSYLPASFTIKRIIAADGVNEDVLVGALFFFICVGSEPTKEIQLFTNILICHGVLK